MSRTFRQSRATERDIRERSHRPFSKFWKRSTHRRQRHFAAKLINSALQEVTA